MSGECRNTTHPPPMHYEIEQKYRCDDLDAVREDALSRGAIAGEVVEQADRYYQHPARDFGETDEAFRLRSVGDRSFLTYKGPKIDAETKSRIEEEVRLAPGEANFAACEEMLRRL